MAITRKKYHCQLEGQANVQKLRNEEKKGNLKNAVFEISGKRNISNGKSWKVKIQIVYYLNLIFNSGERAWK